MRLHSARILIPIAVVVVGWAAVHLVTGRGTLLAQPSTWPGATASATAAPGLATPASQPTPTTGPSAPPPSRPGAPPFLPGVLQQLNGDTRDTALGMAALLSQLEHAVAGDLEQLVQQLEPGG